jgi:hypothetical protein
MALTKKEAAEALARRLLHIGVFGACKTWFMRSSTRYIHGWLVATQDDRIPMGLIALLEDHGIDVPKRFQRCPSNWRRRDDPNVASTEAPPMGYRFMMPDGSGSDIAESNFPTAAMRFLEARGIQAGNVLEALLTLKERNITAEPIR